MSLKDKLESAGVDTFRARCYDIATRVLPKHGGDPVAAYNDYLNALRRDGVLYALLHQAAQDMKNAAGGSYVVDASHIDIDPAAAPIRGSGSQSVDASQLGADARTAPQTQDGAASYSRGASQAWRDRRPAPVSQAMRTAARAVASSSVFDQRISESIGFVWRDLTGRQLMNVAIKHKWLGAIVQELLPLWDGKDPDLPLPKVCTEGKLKDVLQKAGKVRERAALQARRLAHG